MNLDLTQALLNSCKHHERTPARYSVSDLYGIVNGYLTPQTWLYGRPVKLHEAFRMWQGRGKHRQVQELLTDWQIEVKKEYLFEELTLVGVVDAINEDCILEIKTSESVMAKAKEWHKYQARIYCSMFERPLAHVMQPVIKGQRLYLKNLGSVERDDEFFKEQLQLLNKFHKKLCLGKK